MAKKIHELPLTKGQFQLRGIVQGVKSKDFFTEKTLQSKDKSRTVKFSVKYDTDKPVKLVLNGMPKKSVYFSKREEDKTVTKQVAWDNRNTPSAELKDFRIIGTKLGLEKIVNDKGETVNNTKTMVEYDACKYIQENLEDNSSVFVRGEISCTSFVDKSGSAVRAVVLNPNQISLCKIPVDFSSEDYIQRHDFEQDFVFMGITPEVVNENKTGRYIVEGRVINYNSIERIEFIVENPKLAQTFKTNLKPYWSIKVSGRIDCVNVVDTITEEDCWGEVNPMQRISGGTKRELVITGANPRTIDRDTYSEAAINEAMERIAIDRNAEKNFNGSSWGTTTENDDNDDDDDFWG